MTEVHELLATNPAIPLYKYGLPDENMNIVQAGRSEKDRISQLVTDVLRDLACGSGGTLETSIFIRPMIESCASTHGTVCMPSAATVPGPLAHLHICSQSLFRPTHTVFSAAVRIVHRNFPNAILYYFSQRILHNEGVDTWHGWRIRWWGRLSICQSTSDRSFGERIECIDRPRYVNRVRVVAAKCIRGKKRLSISRRRVYDNCVPQSQIQS